MGFLDLPIVGDVLGGLVSHGSQSELQEDSQAFSAQQFARQKEHEVDMFGLESRFASAEAQKAYERQRSLLEHSPRLQMEGLRSAGLNPILAATGGFKSPAGGSMPIASAKAGSGGTGSASPLGAGAKIQIGQAKLLHEQAKLTGAQASLAEAQERKVDKETEFVGNKIDISEPVARAMEKLIEVADNWAKRDGEKSRIIERLIAQSEGSQEDLRRLWNWLKEKYGDAQKAFEEVRRNKGVINLPDIEVR